MTYSFKDQFVDNSKNTNIMHHLFHDKSCQANAIRQARLLTEKVLYFDTYSISYADDGTKHIETGDMLGDMTDELSGQKNH